MFRTEDDSHRHRRRLSPASRQARQETLQTEEDEKRMLLLEQQLAHIRWKKMQNTQEIQKMMHKAAQMQKVDQLDAMSRDRMDERSRWMQAIIRDELQRPLHVARDEKFPALHEVEESVRRDMERVQAHEESVANLQRALQAKEALRLSKIRKLQWQQQQQGNHTNATEKGKVQQPRQQGPQPQPKPQQQQQQQQRKSSSNNDHVGGGRRRAGRDPQGSRGGAAGGATAMNPKRHEHLGKLAALRRDLTRQRREKEREVLKLVRVQRDAPLTPAVRHSVDQHPRQQQRRRHRRP